MTSGTCGQSACIAVHTLRGTAPARSPHPSDPTHFRLPTGARLAAPPRPPWPAAKRLPTTMLASVRWGGGEGAGGWRVPPLVRPKRGSPAHSCATACRRQQSELKTCMHAAHPQPAPAACAACRESLFCRVPAACRPDVCHAPALCLLPADQDSCTWVEDDTRGRIVRTSSCCCAAPAAVAAQLLPHITRQLRSELLVRKRPCRSQLRCPGPERSLLHLLPSACRPAPPPSTCV